MLVPILCTLIAGLLCLSTYLSYELVKVSSEAEWLRDEWVKLKDREDLHVAAANRLRSSILEWEKACTSPRTIKK